MEELARRIWGDKLDFQNDIDRGAWKAFLDTFNDAVEKGFGPVEETDPLRPFTEELRYNNGVFSAFRAHAMQKEIAGQLLDADGNLKSFEQFRKDVEKFVESRWLDGWLRTEYDTAVLRANLARQWKDFEKNKDLFPNLKWMPTTSVYIGEDHRPFWDPVSVIRPIDDPFWNEHRPGDRWNCKCSLQATQEPATDIPESRKNEKPAPGLKGNPAKEGKLFDDSHPYRKQATKKAKTAVKKFIDKQPDNRITGKTFKGGGILQVQGEQNPNERGKNLEAYTFLAKEHGKQYRLLGIRRDGRTNPDALNLETGQYSDAKMQAGGNFKTFIANAAKKASRQGAAEVYCLLKEKPLANDLHNALLAAFQEGRNHNIETVIVRYGKEVQFIYVDALRKELSKNH